jgi:hypothetical protein
LGRELDQKLGALLDHLNVHVPSVVHASRDYLSHDETSRTRRRAT